MDKHTRAFTTGAHIKPVKIEILPGNFAWVWMVVEFDGEQFIDGDDVLLSTVAEKVEDLQEEQDDCWMMDDGNIVLTPVK